MDKWKDKVAVVTGASSGIGAAVARRLVEEGMIVAGAARRIDRLEELQSQLPAGRFHAFRCDVSKEHDIVELFRDIDNKFNRVDVLINNAGVAPSTSLLEPSTEALQTLFAVNVIGPCLCSREYLRVRERNLSHEPGYIMFTNSVAGHRIKPETPGKPSNLIYPYTATKYALKAISEGQRQELRASGSKIRVGEVSPGRVETEIWDSPPKKNTMMQPEEIASAFVFMLSSPEHADVNEIIIQYNGN